MNEQVRMVFAYCPKVSKADEDSLSLVVFKHSSSSVELMRLYVCATLFYSEDLTNLFMILDYSGTLFEKSLGFDAHLSGLMSGFLNTWFFLASFIPWLLIDRIGRRPLVSSLVLASGQYLVHHCKEFLTNFVTAPLHDQPDVGSDGRSSSSHISGPTRNLDCQ